MKNKIQLLIQSKGGVGKSFLTYLISLKHENDETTYFADCDASVKTTTHQLKFLHGREPNRAGSLNLLDNRKMLDRQLLFENLQEISELNRANTFIDFGASESEQLPALISMDYTIHEFKEIEKELDVEIIFNIVIAGGGAYNASISYMQIMANIIHNQFKINLYLNEFTFQNNKELIEEVVVYSKDKKNNINAIKFFGDFDLTTSPHKKILSYIAQGRGMEAYKYIELIKIKKEINKL